LTNIDSGGQTFHQIPVGGRAGEKVTGRKILGSKRVPACGVSKVGIKRTVWEEKGYYPVATRFDIVVWASQTAVCGLKNFDKTWAEARRDHMYN